MELGSAELIETRLLNESQKFLHEGKAIWFLYWSFSYGQQNHRFSYLAARFVWNRPLVLWLRHKLRTKSAELQAGVGQA